MKIKAPRLFITDIDGVWTDGSVYVGPDGTELKKFSIADGWGARHLNRLGIPWAIVTGENSTHVLKRGEKLRCPHIFVGVQNKDEVVSRLLKTLNVAPSETIFLGDDLNDLSVLSLGIPLFCPSDAHPIIQQRATGTLQTKGGQGCFREIVEHFFLNKDFLPEFFH